MSQSIASSKKIKSEISIQIPADSATPAPPVATALGPRGVNLMQFVNAFNEQSRNFIAGEDESISDLLKTKKGTPVKTVITIYEDKTFALKIKGPTVSYYLKKIAGIIKGSKAPKRDEIVAKITLDQCKQIAKLKLKDLNTDDMDAALKMILGSAASLNIQVIEE